MALFAFSIPMALYNSYNYAWPLVIFGALYGFRWKVGMWGNTITLGAVLFSMLIAIGWWEDVAYLLGTNVPQLLFIVDCISIWTIFLISFLILDTATRFMSTVKIKYNNVVENVGNGIVIFMLYAVLLCFITFANDHLGPVGHNHDDAYNALLPSSATDAAISMLQVLSTGNLSGFTQINKFDSDGNLRELHFKRTQALMLNAINGEGPISKIQADESLADQMERRE